MFNILGMMDNHAERLVACYEGDTCTVDTCLVTDSSQPYETGIQSTHYNDNKWIIVEQYDDRESAQAGHDRWVKKMTTGSPATLTDVSTCEIAEFAKILGVDVNQTVENTAKEVDRPDKETKTSEST